VRVLGSGECLVLQNQTKTPMIFNSNKPNSIYRRLGVLVLMPLALSPIALFLIDEWHRQSLMKKYQQAGTAIELPIQQGSWSVESVLQPNEVIACVIDSYGSADDLPALNGQQKLSIPKSKLPSESGLWYMLFFSIDRVERIASWQDPNYQFDLVEQSCGDISARFLISPYYIGGRRSSLGSLSINK
jgi:hypothetical protein